MGIKITKDIKEANCVTHAGTFHADETFATVMLEKILENIVVIRLPEVDSNQLEKNVNVYDIGGGEFDHHQIGGNGKRENGVMYASCGLIWKAFGRRILKEAYSIPDENVEETWELIDRNLVQFIDSDDNGQTPKINTDYKVVTISSIIASLNSKWDEEEQQDAKFMEAIQLARTVFDTIVKDCASKIKAKGIVENAIENSKNRIMILNKHVPWKEFVIESKNEKAKDILFVVFPSNRSGYSVYAVPKEVGSFENRKSLPKAWAGLRDEKLQEVTKVNTARFCHNACFMCVAETFDDAMQMAKMAVESK